MSALNGNPTSLPQFSGGSAAAMHLPDAGKAKDDPRVHEQFNQSVGETFYGQMLKTLRESTGKQRYGFGGRAEKMFTQQFDQILAEKMSRASAGKFSEPMYALYNLQRK